MSLLCEEVTFRDYLRLGAASLAKHVPGGLDGGTPTSGEGRETQGWFQSPVASDLIDGAYVMKLP